MLRIDRSMRRRWLAMCVLGVILASTDAAASIAEYADRSTFESAAGPIQVQDFEAFVPASVDFEGVSFDFGDFSAINGINAGLGGSASSSGSINGSIEINGSTAVDGAELTFSFEYPVSAVGFDADNLADQRVEEIHFDNTAGDVLSISDPVDQVRFWGFVSDTPFTTVTFTLVDSSSGTDGFSIDDMTYSALPEVPSSSAMARMAAVLAISAAALRAAKRR